MGTSWESTSDRFPGNQGRERIQGWSLRIKPRSITPFWRFGHPVNGCWIPTMCQAPLGPGDRAVTKSSSPAVRNQVESGKEQPEKRRENQNAGISRSSIRSFKRHWLVNHINSHSILLTRTSEKYNYACTRCNIAQKVSSKAHIWTIRTTHRKGWKWLKIKKQVSETSFRWIIIGSLNNCLAPPNIVPPKWGRTLVRRGK